MPRRLLVVPGFWPTIANPISGIFVVEQLRAFGRAGVNATVIVPRALGKPESPLLQPRALNLDDQSVELEAAHHLRTPERLSANTLAFNWNLRTTAVSLRRALGRRLQDGDRFDGVISHGIRYPAMCAASWSDQLPCRKLAVVHGVDPFTERAGIASACRAAMRRSSRCFTSIVLVAATMRAYAAGLGVPDDLQVVVPNGTEVPELGNTDIASQCHGRPRIILSVSNLIECKGIDDNLNALRILCNDFKFCDWEYRVVGDGPLRGALETQARQMGISHRVRFLGRLGRNATLDEFNRCDVFSLPSWGEAFGIVYLEAMARSKPTIGCVNAGAGEIVRHGHDGFLVPPRAPQALAATLRTIFAFPNQAEVIAQNARVTAKRFSWDANIRRFLELLELSA